jgi:glyoxylase-like metal-dependent hydrolase (beta-lactamase superfamily II)
MCGNHAADGSPIDHHHGHAPRVFRPTPLPRSRRAFLGDVGKGTLAMAVVTPLIAACSSSSDGGAVATAASESTEPRPTVGPESGASDVPDTEDEALSDATAAPEGAELRWARANLGFVSAYVLARGNSAAIVDTGVEGSASAIGSSLNSLGLNYSDVDHVILTHNHADHAGSIDAVVAEAVNATVYAGEADLGGISQSPITGLRGGEDVFGFEMIATPGHTAGHMCVIDHGAGLLVAGDAIFSEAGGVIEGPERFFADVDQSRESIKMLASLSFNTLLFGHGEPIEDRADTAVAALAASF